MDQHPVKSPRVRTLAPSDQVTPADIRARLRAAGDVLRDRGAGPADRAKASAELAALLAHVRHPEDRRIVSAFAHGFGLEAVAEATGIPADTLRTRLSGAISAIAKALRA